MNGSSLHLKKKYKTQTIHYYLNLFPEWRLDLFIHFENAMFIGHFTPFCHRDCVGAMFNAYYSSNHIQFKYKNLIW
jgi:hypothetical protein